MAPPVLEYFHMNYLPFTEKDENSENCLLTRDLKQTVSIVELATSKQGLSLLYGDSGCGISYAVRYAVQRMDLSSQQFCYMGCFRFSPRDSLKEICRVMNVSPNVKGRQGMITAIREKACACNKQGRPILLVIDHAEILPESILLDLPALTSGELGVGHVMTILLCGTRQLKWQMEALQSEHFRIDLGAHMEFRGASDDETQEYLRLQLSKAGAGADIMTEEALKMAHSVSSHGNYKELNGIMRSALQLCCQAKRTSIDRTVLSAAVSSQKL